MCLFPSAEKALDRNSSPDFDTLGKPGIIDGKQSISGHWAMCQTEEPLGSP